MEECSGWGVACLSQKDVDTDDADGNEETAANTAGGVKQQTTEAASPGKADLLPADDGTTVPTLIRPAILVQ